MRRSLLLLLLGSLGACNGSSGPSADVCSPYQVPAGTNLTSPTVSFPNDVLPILEGSCGLSGSCHSSQTAVSGRVYLGSKTVVTDPTTVRDGLLGASLELPTMPYVTAGDPSKSFLMLKMDGDQCLFDAQCDAAVSGMGCGVSMPQNLPLLDVSTRDTVRRWIAQGAGSD